VITASIFAPAGLDKVRVTAAFPDEKKRVKKSSKLATDFTSHIEQSDFRSCNLKKND